MATSQTICPAGTVNKKYHTAQNIVQQKYRLDMRERGASGDISAALAQCK